MIRQQKIISPLIVLIQSSILVLVLFLPPMAMNIVLVILCVWAFVGRVAAIQSLSLMVVIKYLNPALCQYPQYFGVLCWLVVLCAALRVLPTFSLSHWKLLLPLLFFSLLVSVTSIFASSHVAVSLMKLLSFTVAVATVLIAFAGVDAAETEILSMWFISLYVVVLVLSLPTLFVRSIGFFRNNKGFQGILNHPQVLGTFCAPLFSWGVFRFMDIRNKRYVLYGILLTLLGVFIFCAKSRTAVAAVCGGVGSVVMILLWRGRGGFAGFSPKRGMLVGALAFLLVVGAFALPGVRGAVQDFIYKGEKTNTSVHAAFEDSRGKIVVSQWHNFLRKPLTGNGFGVYADGRFPSGVKTFMGIPVSASVEKGIMFTALLEETGLLGFGAFLVFFLVLIRMVANTTEYQWIAMFFSCFFINFGEDVFFSVGGIGLFYWLLMGLSLAAARNEAITGTIAG